MVEQQLIDYIKKARDAGQTDDQTRDLLYKNGWTEAEVSDAIMSMQQPQVQSEPKPQVQPRVQPQPQPQTNPESQTIDLSKFKTQPEEIQPQPQEVQPQVMAQPPQQPEPQVIRPEPQYQPQPQSMPTNMPKTKRKGGLHIIKLLLILIIVVVLGGIGYFTAGQYLNLPYSNFLFSLFKQEDPQTVINNMLANMKDLKVSHTIMQLEIDATNLDTKTSQGKLILTTNSEADQTDAKNIKSDGNFIFNFTTPAVASTGQPTAVSATVSFASIGSTYYVKLDDILSPGNTTGLTDLVPNDVFSQISNIKGKWLQIDQDSLKTLSEASAGQATTAIDISQLSQAQANASNLSKQVRDLVASENIFSDAKQLNNETINGQDTYHYSITISKDKLADLFNKLMTLEMQQASQSEGNNATGASNSALVQNMAQAVVKTFVDSVGDINMEIWVGKKDYMLYQVKMDKLVDLGKLLQSYAGSAISISGANTQIEAKFSMTNSNFNKPITVQAPAGAQKIEDVLLPLIKIQAINSDMDEIGWDAQNLFFANKSYSLLCKSGFLNGSQKTSYGLDFIKKVNDIVKQGGKNPICFAGVQNYCVSTQLADGTYLCIDKNKKIGKTKCINAQTVCK